MLSPDSFDGFLQKTCPFQQITVVGLGLVGGSLLMALREAFPKVRLVGVDVNPNALSYVLSHRLADAAYAALPESLPSGHLIILGSHLPVNQQVLEAMAPKVQQDPSVVVMDLGSCKRAIVELGAKVLPQQFMGGHPMAGREVSGIENALSLLFAGKKFILTPHASGQNAALLEKITPVVEAIGAVPVVLDSETHDRNMAYISHFPQLYAILLTNLLARHEPGRILSLHGGGIDDQLRLAASSYAMWGPVYHENLDNMRSVVDELYTLLGQLRDDLDSPALEGWFHTSNQIHKAFQQLKRPKKEASTVTALQNVLLAGREDSMS
jgi:prephenate dehydrogenase